MARKKTEDEQKADASITEKLGDVVAAVGEKVSEVVTPVAEKVSEVVAPAISTVGDTVGGAIAAVTGRSGDAKAVDEDAPPAENEENLPTTISKGAASSQGKQLPEYLQTRRTEIGRVVSDKMQKTVVVSVSRSKAHPIYKKVVRQTVKFMAHDELNSGMGDTVRIIESRPMSRRKRWQVIEIVQKAQQL